MASFLSGGATPYLSGWRRHGFILKRVLHGFALEQRCDFILERLVTASLHPQASEAVEGFAAMIGPLAACHGNPVMLGPGRPRASRASNSLIRPPPPSSCVDPNSSHRPPPPVEDDTVEGLAEGMWGPSRGLTDCRRRLQ
jgi:hypothetical protein